jgi:hypothetical protein
LTQEAEFFLMAELRARGYGDRDNALHAGAAMVAATRHETMARAAPSSPHFASLMVSALIFVALACVSLLAPLIWHSPADRVCQKAGYWYASDTGLTQIHCFGWRPL